MNGTTDMADFLSQSEREELRRPLPIVRFETINLPTRYSRVSKNLGFYLLFCLFGLAILALFLWSSMQALQTSLFFFVLRRQVWQVFIYVSINFYRRGTLDSVSVKRRLRTADCRLRTRGKMQTECKMQTAD